MVNTKRPEDEPGLSQYRFQLEVAPHTLYKTIYSDGRPEEFRLHTDLPRGKHIAKLASPPTVALFLHAVELNNSACDLLMDLGNDLIYKFEQEHTKKGSHPGVFSFLPVEQRQGKVIWKAEDREVLEYKGRLRYDVYADQPDREHVYAFSHVVTDKEESRLVRHCVCMTQYVRELVLEYAHKPGKKLLKT